MDKSKVGLCTLQSGDFNARVERLCKELADSDAGRCVSYVMEAIELQQAQQHSKLLVVSDILKDFFWEKLHIGYWRDVQSVWRDAYALASVWHASATLHGAMNVENGVFSESGCLNGGAPTTADRAATQGRGGLAGPGAGDVGVPLHLVNGNGDGTADSVEGSHSVTEAGREGGPRREELAAVLRGLDMAVLMGGALFRDDIEHFIERITQALKAPDADADTQPRNAFSESMDVSAKRMAEDLHNLAAVRPQKRHKVLADGRRPSGHCAGNDEAQPVAGMSMSRRSSECLHLGHDVGCLPSNMKDACRPPSDSFGAHARAVEVRELIPLTVFFKDYMAKLPDEGMHACGASKADALAPECVTIRQRSQRVPVQDVGTSCGCAQDGDQTPSLAGAAAAHGTPVVIAGAMSHWPAMHRWRDMGYLKAVAGQRTVPLEVGQHYLADGWSQKLMRFSDFIDGHVLAPCQPESPEPTAASLTQIHYLAQHQLFEQIPGLRKDICIPDYCTLGRGDVRSVNAWLGPSSTTTPLHHDPHHNLLAQVFGRKYVRLYSPLYSAQLSPYERGLTTNASQIDLDNMDHKGHPEFSNLPSNECILEGGQMLYIPPYWWHYVKALTPSFSVSFWWH